jgi:hypothetical protein
MRTNRRYAYLIGACLLVEGVWGLSHSVIFHVLTTNHVHSLIHLLLGTAGIWVATTKHASGFATFLGLGLLALGGLWFLEEPRELLVRWLNLNQAGASLTIAVGVVSLLVGIGTRADLVKTR